LQYKIQQQILENNRKRDCEGKVSRYNASKKMLDNSFFLLPRDKYINGVANLKELKNRYKEKCPGYNFSIKRKSKRKSKMKSPKMKSPKRKSPKRKSPKRK